MQALRSGGILAARSVAMSVMVQLGGLLLHSLTRGCDIIDERVLVPLLRLRRLTAATLLTAIEAWMLACILFVFGRLSRFKFFLAFTPLKMDSFGVTQLSNFLVLQIWSA